MFFFNILIMDNEYIKKNFKTLFGVNFLYTLYFLLENNRAELLDYIKKIKPQIIINDIFTNIETVDNYRLAMFLTNYLDIADLKKLSNFKFSYNSIIDNWTTLESIKNILISKGFINSVKNSNRESENETKGSLLNAFLGFITSGEKTITTTNKPQKKNDNSTIIIISIIVILIIVALVIFKNKIF